MLKNVFGIVLGIFPRPVLIRFSMYLLPLFRLLFKGSRFTDPIDKSSFRTLLPYGYQKQRANVLSPSTLSLERHRLLWLYLERSTTFFNTDQKLHVLHVAPEQCFHPRFKRLAHLDYTTFDQNSPLATVKGDLRALPFADKSFDVVFCNHVLEHIIDDDKAMRELYRVLKPSGWGIVQVPMKPDQDETYEDHSIQTKKEREVHFGQYDHVRWYGRKDFFKRLQKAGFSTEAIYVSQAFSKTEIERYALDHNEILPIIRR